SRAAVTQGRRAKRPLACGCRRSSAAVSSSFCAESPGSRERVFLRMLFTLAIEPAPAQARLLVCACCAVGDEDAKDNKRAVQEVRVDQRGLSAPCFALANRLAQFLE